MHLPVSTTTRNVASLITASSLVFLIVVSGPCLIAIFLLPKAPHHPQTLIGDFGRDHVLRAYVGSPPRTMDLKLDETSCGITIRGAQWQHVASAAVVGGNAIVSETVLIGDVRLAGIPVKYDTTTDIPLQSTLGLCQGVPSSWGLSENIVYKGSAFCIGELCDTQLDGCRTGRGIVKNAIVGEEDAMVISTCTEQQVKHNNNVWMKMHGTCSIVPLFTSEHTQDMNRTISVGPRTTHKGSVISGTHITGSSERFGRTVTLYVCDVCMHWRAIVAVFVTTTVVCSHAWNALSTAIEKDTRMRMRRKRRDIDTTMIMEKQQLIGIGVLSTVSSISCLICALCTTTQQITKTHMIMFVVLVVGPIIVYIIHASCGCICNRNTWSENQKTLGTFAVLIPCYASFWACATNEEDVVARAILAGGSAIVCTTCSSFIAVRTMYRFAWLSPHNRPSIIVIAIVLTFTSLSTLVTYAYTILPLARLVGGDTMPIRLVVCAAVIIFTITPSTAIAARSP